MNFLYRAWDFWLLWRNEPVPLKKSLFIISLAVIIAFLLGGQYPESGYQKLQEQLEQLWEKERNFAEINTRLNKELIRIRASEKINDKTIAALEKKIINLSNDNINHREEVVFFREALGNISAKQDLSIYALDESPDFRPNRRRLHAALVRTSKKKEFQGSYYFEVIFADTNEITHIPEKPAALKFSLYQEIEEIIELSEDIEIKNLRLLVLDKKGNIVTQETLLTENERKAVSVLPVHL